MRKLTFIAGLIVLSSFFAAPIAHGAAGDLPYVPLEPIGQLTNITQGNLPDLLNAVFKILFSLGGLLAVGELVAGGIMYMTSETPVTLGSAKSRIWAAFYGLLILAGSYLILYTINPDLLNLNLTIQTGSYTTSTNSSNPIQTTSGNSSGSGSFSGLDCSNRAQVQSRNDGCIITCTAGCANALGLSSSDVGSGKSSIWFYTADIGSSQTQKAINAFSASCSGHSVPKQNTTSSGVQLTVYVCI
jgi:hypothetical protein